MKKERKINRHQIEFFVLIAIFLAWTIFVFAYDRAKAKTEKIDCQINLEEAVQPISRPMDNVEKQAKKTKLEKLFIEHKVKKGESLSEISRFYGVELKDIAKENKLGRQRLIYVGQRLKIPTPAYLGRDFIYTVKRGDTIASIAERFGTFGWIIKSDNKIRKFIFPGQKLKIRPVILPKMKVKASWYGRRFHNKKAANGKNFNMYKLTAAHRWLPLGSKLQVRLGKKTIVVEITDRGPYYYDRAIDLSYAAAKKLRPVFEYGTSDVTVRSVN